MVQTISTPYLTLDTANLREKKKMTSTRTKTTKKKNQDDEEGYEWILDDR